MTGSRRSLPAPASRHFSSLGEDVGADGEIWRSGDKGVIPPRVVNLAKPTYTAAALERRIEGTVEIRRRYSPTAPRRRREDPPVSRSGA